MVAHRSDRGLKFAARLCRLAVGLLFIFAGFVKAVDPWGTSLVINDYLVTYGLDWALPAALVLSIWVSGAELMMGCMLTFKVRIQLVSIFAFVTTFLFTVVTLLGATIFPVEDCGCLGKAIHLTPWETFFKNLVLLPMTFVIFWRYNRYGISALRMFKLSEFLLAAMFFLFSMGLGTYCYHHLPLVDFLPYRVGVDLNSLDQVNSTAGYTTKLIYRNRLSGVLREFALEDLEWRDGSVWEWVESRSEASSATSLGVVARFAVQDSRGFDCTSDLLSYSGPLHLVVVDDFSSLDDWCRGRIERFVSAALSRGEGAACLTTDTIDPDTTFLGLPCYNIDKSTRNNLLRSRSGVITLDEGVISQKRSCRDL